VNGLGGNAILHISLQRPMSHVKDRRSRPESLFAKIDIPAPPKVNLIKILAMHVDPDDWDQALPNQRLLPIKSLNLGAFRKRKFLCRRYAIFLVLAIAMASLTGLIWSMFRDTLPDGGVAFGDEEQDTSSPEAIVSQCEIFMRKNLLTGTAYGYNYSFNRPSSFKYSPSQWLWGKILSGLFRQASLR
jgi:hypothetical protein